MTVNRFYRIFDAGLQNTDNKECYGTYIPYAHLGGEIREINAI